MLKCDVGFMGLAGSGKDTAAKALTAHGWVRTGFADELKKLAWTLGWNGMKDEKGRRFLQDLGMAVRGYNENYWVNYLAARLFSNETYVFTDVRFPNEAKLIKDRGGILIRIIMPLVTASDTHISESAHTAITPDHIVMNDGTIEELHAKIMKIVHI